MATSLILTEQAEHDLTDAADWYDRDRPGRAARFLTRVDACLAHVRRSPRLSAVVRSPDVRRAVVTGFPYIVVYRHDAAADAVIVLTVWHTSRNPDDLLDRLPPP